ncbi:MAG: phosphodiester glycosidase family protein [Solobacterium sp.]|nr:phosphodiester glycosidase family protein [Solobacterium sp.]
MKQKFMHITDCLIILAVTVWALLDFFIIPKTYAQDTAVTAEPVTETAPEPTAVATAAVTATSYTDENITIELKTYRVNNTTVYVADVQLSSIEYLKTAFAANTAGRNITAKTSEIASDANAILAINGDFYGARDRGYVIRNGILYRSASSGSDQEDLVIHSDGSFAIIQESETSAETLVSDNVLQVFSFGPGLLENGELLVGVNDEVDRSMSSNPRTAIAEIEPLHYLFVVSDGRTSESEGLTIYELAQFLQTLGAKTAYNLDGGGSSTMVFNGQLVNKPTTTGKIKERSVSDIVCISL